MLAEEDMKEEELDGNAVKMNNTKWETIQINFASFTVYCLAFSITYTLPTKLSLYNVCACMTVCLNMWIHNIHYK